jgi:hypothetical protein
MNPRFAPICLAILTLAAFPALAAVTVSFPSGYYTDIGRPGSVDADNAKRDIARILESLDARYLAPGDVIDVDLAGDRIYSGAREFRVAKGKSDFPRFVLRYRLERDGKVSAGEDTVDEVNYLQSMSKLGSAESMYHEKLLLENWFKARFAR